MSARFGKVVLFGDSLTQCSFSPGGWGARLADRLQRRADVLNRGLSGYNTEWAKLILPQLISDKEPPDAVVVFFGANDSALADFNPQQHVPLDRFKANIGEICSHLTESTGVQKCSVILASPPPLCDHLWAKHCQEKGIPPNRSNVVTEQYATAVVEVGSKLGVRTVDLFSAFSQKPSMELCFSDGLHFSTDGEKFSADLIIPVVEQALHDFPPLFPDWSAVNVQNPRETFSLPCTEPSSCLS